MLGIGNKFGESIGHLKFYKIMLLCKNGIEWKCTEYPHQLQYLTDRTESLTKVADSIRFKTNELNRTVIQSRIISYAHQHTNHGKRDKRLPRTRLQLALTRCRENSNCMHTATNIVILGSLNVLHMFHRTPVTRQPDGEYRTRQFYVRITFKYLGTNVLSRSVDSHSEIASLSVVTLM